MSLLTSSNLRRFLLTFVLVYATVAGLQTVADFDLRWQMAAAQHPFSSVDTLSYPEFDLIFVHYTICILPQSA
jgi:hypothetical protein